VEAGEDAEDGRGMALIEALAVRWGVQAVPDGKITWCELSTGLMAPDGHVVSAEVIRAEALLSYYVTEPDPLSPVKSRVTFTAAEEAAIGAIADLLHWFHAHGRDVDEALDRAQTHFDAGFRQAD
jgi:hypothetical protein